MKLIDAFKALCFDHESNSSFDDYLARWVSLEQQGLGPQLENCTAELIRLEVLQEHIANLDFESKAREVFDAWHEFWCAATKQLDKISKFTFEGQKYFAYLDERQNIEREMFLSGAASYDHVIVDEFQDINPLDLALIRAIINRNRATLTITGDDDQAIFEWRGATPNYILKPSEYFASKSFDTYTLGVNYRSPANIVEHSQCLINNNKFREPKTIRPFVSERAKVEVRETESLSEALNYVHSLYDSFVSKGVKPSQLALISRLKSQIIPYQIYFASREISFCAAEDLQIFYSDTFDRLLSLLEIKTRKESFRTSEVVKDILLLCDYVKWFRLSKRDRPALTRWLTESRPKSLMDGILRLAEYRGELKSRSNSDGRVSLEMVDPICKFMDTEFVSDSLISLSENFEGLQKDFVKAEDDFFFKDPPFLYLADYAKRYRDNYDEFLEHIEMARNTLAHIPPADKKWEDISKYPIQLMTANRAKGKEFNTVVILDVEDKIWPTKHDLTDAELEAARRLFYVAFTRARKQVTMLLRKGKMKSPFIAELRLPE